jgi:hypothetical protein
MTAEETIETAKSLRALRLSLRTLREILIHSLSDVYVLVR